MKNVEKKIYENIKTGNNKKNLIKNVNKNILSSMNIILNEKNVKKKIKIKFKKK
jgi:hypothetical protein